MAKSGLCESCVSAKWCDSWGEWRCVKKAQRIYDDVLKCSAYKKRPKDFKESGCQCEECLARMDVELEED